MTMTNGIAKIREKIRVWPTYSLALKDKKTEGTPKKTKIEKKKLILKRNDTNVAKNG